MTTELYNADLFGASMAPKPSGPVAEQFLFPPFSVFDARSGDWQERKRAWTSIGLKSEVGRGENLLKMSDACMKGGNGTSVFDPALCESIYRWFSPEGGQIVDPFAGGSVRGIVAGAMGRRYWGCDLRQEQIDANEAQADEIQPLVRPTWICGDSAVKVQDAPLADLVFSCPPYGDLEVYSDSPSDLSNMSWAEFCVSYRLIIKEAVARLKPNRFACFVIGDFRDKKGLYRNFVSETIEAFHQAGAYLYNEAILVTPAGSASLRAARIFNGSRKLVKVHQNVLVFVKGDPKIAATASMAPAIDAPLKDEEDDEESASNG